MQPRIPKSRAAWRRSTTTLPTSERENLDGLRARLGSASITYVPYLARDVYDFGALHEVGQVLLGEPTGDELV